MHQQIRAHWPEAPIVESNTRWARLRAPAGGVVYIEHYAWDEETRPQYVVAWHSGSDEPDQVRYPELLEAIEELRARCSRELVALG